MQQIQRKRKTDYPRTFLILKKGNNFYLLFWLEHGKDDSLYIWFDDDPDNSWELAAIHNQKKFFGTTNVTLEHKPYEIFDPHISWHPSGKIHVTGYNKKGSKGARVLSDKSADPLYKMVSGTTIPISQIILPTINIESLKYLGDDLFKIVPPKSWVGILDKNGFHIANNSAPGEGFLIVDNTLIPAKHNLGVDISAYWKGNTPNFEGKTDIGFNESMLYKNPFSINRGATGIAACLRVFSLEFGDKPNTLWHIVATCFNKESTDLFQLRKLIT